MEEAFQNPQNRWFLTIGRQEGLEGEIGNLKQNSITVVENGTEPRNYQINMMMRF